MADNTTLVDVDGHVFEVDRNAWAYNRDKVEDALRASLDARPLKDVG
jgi:hypothetical protein